MHYIIVITLIALSALFSGLTLGFFSLNRDDLERKAELGDTRAKKIFSVRKNGNLLLCTLLIGNVAVNSVVSVLLSALVASTLAVIMATALIVVFGEILPQAIFARHALTFGSRLVWLTRLFIIILFPLCWPLAKLLDKILGNEIPTIYSKKELVKLIEKHEDSLHSDIDADEEKIVKGGLSFSDKTVRDVMTPRGDITSVNAAQPVNDELLLEIARSGHSRIPVYAKTSDNIIGTLYVKDLVQRMARAKTVRAIARKNAIFVSPDKRLDDLFNMFKKTRNHLFIVKEKTGALAGIVTIEDVLEEIIGSEIIDEFDYDER